MATSSFSKEFIIEKPEAVEQLIDALNNPVTIKVKQFDLEKEEKEALCKLFNLLDSRKS